MTPKQKRRNRLKRNMRIISRLYNGVTYVYGPYNNSVDGRYRVYLKGPNFHTVKQYSKLKMEIKLGRTLGIDETVAHLDDNFHNDRYSNLKVIPRKKHAELDVIRVKRHKVKCLWCKKKFTPTRNQCRPDRKSGPFCSRSCTGKYGANVQNGGKEIKQRKIKKTYYKNSGNAV